MAKKGKSSYMKMQQGAQRSSNVKTKQEKVPQGGKQSVGQQYKSKTQRRGAGLLEKLTFCPEYRRDGGVTQPLEEGVGRFRYFWSVAKRRNGSILLANLMFILFVLPLVAVAVTVRVGGVENIAYYLQKMSAPYLMTNVGFGISESAYTHADVSRYIANVYYITFACAGVGALIMSIGLSGMMPLCMNFILGDTFLSKKDNYGNDVPRAIKEFFFGIKKYWWQFLIVGAMMLALVAGIGNVFVYFVSSFKLGEAGVGHWFMIIFAGIIALFGLMFLLHLMPIIVLYDMPFKKKMKNAAVFAVQMFVQNFAIIAVFTAPFLVLSLTNTIVSAIVLAVLLVYGSKYYCLTMCNYEQYISEKIIMTIYNAKNNPGKKKNKKTK
ncbi:MAG: hypothetical protein J5781_02600 [Clostridia bacterium]|nr:hypothetical protein [Clostridia bacterium]